MEAQREVLERQRAEYKDKARSLKAYIEQLTDTVAKCGTHPHLLEAVHTHTQGEKNETHAQLEEDLTQAQNDAQFYEQEAARIGELLGAEEEKEKTKTTYVVQEDAAGEWRWKLLAGNHQVIADSGESYRHKQDCLHGIELVKNSKDAPVKEKGKH
jgi:uncharacterized protein YegP (UPF0339 family)